LYYTDGLVDTWSPRSLPAPVNTAGDSPPYGYGQLVAVDAMGSLGSFAVLTSSGSVTSGSVPSEMRSWIYTCDSSGSSPASWTSTQMTSGSATGHPYNLRGHDLTASNGSPVAVLSSGSYSATVPVYGWAIEKITDKRNAWDFWGIRPDGDIGWVCDSRMSMDWYCYAEDQTTLKVVLNSTFWSTVNPPDFVYLYGNWGEQVEVDALTDGLGYRYWPFMVDFAYPVKGVWVATIRLGLLDPLQTYGSRTLRFNIFGLKRGLPPWPSLTHGDRCEDYHLRGFSPYGDRRPGPKDPFMPMPIHSTLLAGMIYWI
jgi:hypothetical protein